MREVGPTSGRPLTRYDAPKRPGEVERALRAEYERYVARQCQAFLRLVPHEGVRPLYACAREWAKERGVHQSKDPMPSLLGFCRSRLPLPPFEAWLQDYRACRVAYAVDAASAPVSEEDRAPKRVLTRGLSHARRRWFAGLHLFKDGPTWRGYISFREVRSALPRGSVVPAPSIERRTADIFCESDPSAIERRFTGYRSDTLRGFLRSTLP